MLPRFHVPDLDTAREAALPPEEARHLTRVLRLGDGDEIAVFDGRGHEFHARVIEADRERVRVALLGPIAAAPEAHTPLTLVQAILKGDKMDEVVRDATMMGVATIAPVVSARTIAKRQTVERWERVAVSSTKQCRRAVVPAVTPVMTIEAWLAATDIDMKLLLVEPAAAGGQEQSINALRGRTPRSVAVIVGPEGGWTAGERDTMIAAGCLPATLGPLTLRADAVPLVAIALVRFALNDL
ncbi:MAG TPA: 16S rRNA (uracil(1498)-N(3))-methyltransferase [Vicinamibacterales bacterium]